MHKLELNGTANCYVTVTLNLRGNCYTEIVSIIGSRILVVAEIKRNDLEVLTVATLRSITLAFQDLVSLFGSNNQGQVVVLSVKSSPDASKTNVTTSTTLRVNRICNSSKTSTGSYQEDGILDLSGITLIILLNLVCTFAGLYTGHVGVKITVGL